MSLHHEVQSSNNGNEKKIQQVNKNHHLWSNHFHFKQEIKLLTIFLCEEAGISITKGHTPCDIKIKQNAGIHGAF